MGNAVKSLVNALGVVQESAVEKTGKVVRKAAPQVKVVIIIMPASLPLTKKPTPSPTKKPTSPTKKPTPSDTKKPWSPMLWCDKHWQNQNEEFKNLRACNDHCVPISCDSASIDIQVRK